MSSEIPGSKNWAKVYLEKIQEKFGEIPVVRIGSGISLSGPVHVGHLREFIIAKRIQTELEALGKKTDFYAFADDMDPLKKLYSFLPPKYEKYIGVPLYLIPSPIDSQKSYADYYLEEFIKTLDTLDIYPTIIQSSKEYSSGRKNDLVKLMFENERTCSEMIASVTGSKDLTKNIFQFICPECARCTDIQVLENNYPFFLLKCHKCNQKSSVDISTNGGKLKWRYDWPTRWYQFGIHIEPVAQDHATKGGSYDSSSYLLENFFQTSAPIPVKYAWVRSKKSQALHTTSGVTSAKELLNAYPVGIINSMYNRISPKDPVYFDFESSLLEEYKYLRRNQISCEGITLNQDINKILAELRFDKKEITTSEQEKLKNWLSVVEAVVIRDIPSVWKAYACKVLIKLEQSTEWNEIAVSKAIEEAANEHSLTVKESYYALYQILFSTPTGPKLAKYLSSQNQGEVVSTLSEQLNQLKTLIE